MEIFIYLCIVLASVTQSASTKAYNRGGGASLVFKERLKPNQYAALTLGVLAIVLMKL